jgi:hypothetical protein
MDRFGAGGTDELRRFSRRPKKLMAVGIGC